MCNPDKREVTSKLNGLKGGRPRTKTREEAESLKVGEILLIHSRAKKLRFQQVNQKNRTGKLFKYGYYAPGFGAGPQRPVTHFRCDVRMYASSQGRC